MYRFLNCKKLNLILLFMNNIYINKINLGFYLYRYVSKKFWNFIIKKQIININETNLNLFYNKNINYLLTEIYFLIK